MTDLEFDIRATARDLQKLYERMDDMKHEGGLRRETRVQRPAPGPQSPGNWLWLNRSITKEQELREVAFNAFSDIGVKLKDGDARVQRLLELIAYNAQPISELGWASDFYDELNGQARTIGRWVNPPETKEVAKRPEPRQVSEVILQRLSRLGRPTSPVTLRTWASKGHISTELRNNRSTYLMSEIVDHLNRGDKEESADEN